MIQMQHQGSTLSILIAAIVLALVLKKKQTHFVPVESPVSRKVNHKQQNHTHPNHIQYNVRRSIETQFQYIVVLNPESFQDEKRSITQELQKHSIHPVHFVQAQDPRNITASERIKQLFQFNSFQSKASIISRALTHHSIWQRLSLDPLHDFYIVIDQETMTSNQLDTFVKRNMQELVNQDIVILDKTKHSSELCNFQPLQTLSSESLQAYSINQSCARKACRFIFNNGIQHPIETILEVSCGMPPVSTYAPLFKRTAQPHVWRDVSVDLGISQDTLDSFYNSQFKALPNKVPTGKILYKTTIQGSELLQRALAEPDCAGFSEDGTLFRSIESVRHEPSARALFVRSTLHGARPLQLPVNVAMYGHWDDQNKIVQYFNSMLDVPAEFNRIRFVSDSQAQSPEFCLVINNPYESKTRLDHSKTIVFQMEPRDYFNNLSHIHRDYCNPDRAEFFHVHSHSHFLNAAQWFFAIPRSLPLQRIDSALCILSAKIEYPGHRIRTHFCRYAGEHAFHLVHVMGRSNSHHLKNYHGPLIDDCKSNHLPMYKYYLACENNKEHNYATEKIFEPLLSECLPFYWGCPNLEQHLEPESFVRLPLEDPPKALAILQQAIDEDWHSQRLGAIRRSKQKIIQHFGMFSVLETVLAAKM